MQSRFRALDIEADIVADYRTLLSCQRLAMSKLQNE